MATKAKPEPKPGNSGVNADDAKGYVDRLERLALDREQIMEDAREECAPIKEDEKRVFEEAKDNGVSGKSLRAVLKSRRLERKANEARSKLSGADKDQYDLIRHAIGDLADTPLGQAALGNGAAANA